MSDAEFERCWPWLVGAMMRYGQTHTKEQVADSVKTGAAQLWPMKNAAILTAIKVYPSGLRELSGWLAGGELTEIQEWEPVLAAWGRENGCRRFLIAGRRGWLRTLNGYYDAGTVLAKDL